MAVLQQTIFAAKISANAGALTALSPDEDTIGKLAAELGAKPNFPAAILCYTRGLHRFRQSSRLMNKIVATDTRWRIIGLLLYLHSDRETFGPDGGATFNRLLSLCPRRQEASPRAVKTMVALLQLTGFVKCVRSSTDARSKYYVPTARMDVFVRQWFSYAVAALDILEPALQRSRLFDEDPDFIAKFFTDGGRNYFVQEAPGDRLDEFTSFFNNFEGAYPVIVTVRMAEMTETPVPSRGQIAKHFGLSKTQVSNVVASAIAQGFLATADGSLRSTDRLRDFYAGWVAIELAFYALHMRGAN